MKKTVLFGFVLAMLISSCKKTSIQQDENLNQDLIPAEAIDAFIKKEITDKHVFEWSSASSQMVWIAAPGCCSKCTSINGKTADVGFAWMIDGVAVLNPPLHPNCRCTIGVS